MDETPLLSIKNLRIAFPIQSADGYSDLFVVNDVSLNLGAGEILAVVGESGSGKTTLALATLGLIPSPGLIKSGKILFKGLDLLTLSKETTRHYRGNRISIIFQDPTTALNPTLTVGDQISEAYILHNQNSHIKAQELVIDLLVKVGINDPRRIFDSYPHQLSGGLRQRAIIAMALICKPELLIADEPTTSLDTTIQAQILDLLLDLQEQFGMSILFISHNLAVVSQFAHKVAVMYAGKIMEILPTKDIVTKSIHPYTKSLLGLLPSIETRGQVLPTLPGSLSEEDVLSLGCPFSKRCPSVKEICNVECPSLSSTSTQHQFACHAVPTINGLS